MANHENKLCHVGNYHEIEKQAIRETVCRSLSIEDDGYCILHSPRPNKDQQRFSEIFNERIKHNDGYFEAVVFPIPLDFNHCEFTLPLNFSRATFLSHVTLYDMRIKYIYCLFGEVARFNGAVFKREAWFTGSHFKESTFDHATFNGHKLGSGVGSNVATSLRRLPADLLTFRSVQKRSR